MVAPARAADGPRRFGPAAELILASTSAARVALMDALGLPYRAVKPDFEEHANATDPLVLARELALGKARAVAKRFPDALVLGADQVCAFEGEIWGKPHDANDAARQLARLAGRTHQLVTGVALCGPGLERVEHEVAELSMFALGREEQDAYVATREWEGCAGGYRVEARGLALFAEIRGDLNNVRGLPMTRVVRMLREAGVRFFEPV